MEECVSYNQLSTAWSFCTPPLCVLLAAQALCQHSQFTLPGLTLGQGRGLGPPLFPTVGAPFFSAQEARPPAGSASSHVARSLVFLFTSFPSLPRTGSGHMSTVHVGAFILMASEIILAPDSPM